MLREDKERLVAELTERLERSETLIVADYRGLTVTDIDKLRTDLLSHGARFTVVKNTLTKRAAEEAGVPERPSISTRQTRQEPNASNMSVAQGLGISTPRSIAARITEVPSGTVTARPSILSVTVFSAFDAGVP